MKVLVGVCSLCCVASVEAQPLFANIFWEANDGSGWTRNAMVTVQSGVDVRMIAEFGGAGTTAFGGCSIDAIIQGTSLGDTVSSAQRASAFTLAGQTLATTRFGTTLKIDDIRDTSAPGGGTFWINCSQAPPNDEINVNHSNPIVVVTYHLNFDNTFGTRHVSQFQRVLQGQSAYLYLNDGTVAGVLGNYVSLDVTYIPGPSAIVALATASFVAQVRRRKRA